jgi:hypothetical protein
MAMELLGSTDWRSGTCAPYGIVEACATARVTWRRGRRALARLEAEHLAKVELHPFHAGRVTLRRSDLVHDRAMATERFVQLMPSAVADIVAEHDLSWTATCVLRELILMVDHSRRLITTLVGLGDLLNVGRVSLRSALDALAAAGLLAYEVTRGMGTVVTLLAWDALVASPGRSVLRRERRAASRDPEGLMDIYRRLAAHFGLLVDQLTTSAGLAGAVSGALLAGMRPDDLVGAVAGRGNLGGLRDPVAGLVARVRQATSAFLDARSADQARREARAAKETRVAALDAAEEAERATAAGESAWLASVLDDSALAQLAGLHKRSAAGLRLPVPALAAMVLTHARRAVAADPEADPLAAIMARASRPLADGATGTLPRAGPGRSLVERLRALG